MEIKFGQVWVFWEEPYTLAIVTNIYTHLNERGEIIIIEFLLGEKVKTKTSIEAFEMLFNFLM